MEITKEMLYTASQAANHQQLRVMYDAMKSERDALAATVDALREMAGRANAHLTKGYATQNFNQEDCNLALSALAEINSFTPQHHLRQVRADAVTESADKMGDAFILPANLRRETNKAEFYKAGWRDAFLFLKQYAASIRQDGK